jgi:hypothetical protein
MTEEQKEAMRLGRERAAARRKAEREQPAVLAPKQTPNEALKSIRAAEKLAAESREAADRAVEAARVTALQAKAAVAAAEKINRRIPNPPQVRMIVGAPPPPRGHARKFGDEAQRTYLDAIARGISPGDAAKLAGVNRGNVNALRKADPAFAEAEEEARAGVNELVEEALLQAALSGNVDAMKTWLFNRSREAWAPPQKLQLEVSGQLDHSYDVGAGIERIAQLQATLTARAALNAGGSSDDVVDVEAVD